MSVKSETFSRVSVVTTVANSRDTIIRTLNYYVLNISQYKGMCEGGYPPLKGKGNVVLITYVGGACLFF